MNTENDLNTTDLSLKLLIVFSRAHRTIVDLLVDDMKRYSLNLTEFAVLELLFNKGDQPIQHIGKQVLLTSGSITYVVDRLEQKKFLLRKPCPKDKRVTFTILTDLGRELMSDIFPKHHERIQEIFAGVDESEMKELIHLLKKLGLFAQNNV